MGLVYSETEHETRMENQIWMPDGVSAAHVKELSDSGNIQ